MSEFLIKSTNGDDIPQTFTVEFVHQGCSDWGDEVEQGSEALQDVDQFISIDTCMFINPVFSSADSDNPSLSFNHDLAEVVDVNSGRQGARRRTRREEVEGRG